MPHYTIQYNKREQSYTVFDENNIWVAVFQDLGHACRFIKTVLNGTFVEL